jgi:peptide-methionine (S)-S-oxide reductase
VIHSLLATLLLGASAATTNAQTTQPAPAATKSAFATATLSGGCYWTMEAVFEHTRGVVDVVSGMTGSGVDVTAYLRNPTATAGAAEAVRITYDPSNITYEELLRVFFTVAHDPTQINKQGPDAGSRYRSVVWVTDDAQHKAALHAIAALDTKGGKSAIATQIARTTTFAPVRESEQDFAAKNPTHPYITYWDVPKLAKYRKDMPTFYRER